MPLSPVPTLRRKKGTEKLAPVICAHAAAEEGHREACSCHLCPRCGRRRVQEGVRRITPKVKTVICKQAPNHGSYFAYARLIARVNSQFSSPRQACAAPFPPALWSGSGCHGFPVLRRLRRSSRYHPGIRSLLPSIHNVSKAIDRSPVPA